MTIYHLERNIKRRFSFGFYIFILIIKLSNCQHTNQDWGLAITKDDQIILLSKDGATINPLLEQFSRLKALAFDNVKQDLIVSDTNQENDTIYSIGTHESSNKTFIIDDVADNILGLAVDSETHTLYWSDTKNKVIYQISLDDPSSGSKIFMEFNSTQPEGLAIDTCRRYIYWINSHENNPSIERAHLVNKETEILVDTDIRMPMGLTIDPIEQRIYWTDLLEGIYYKIESVDFNGEDRKIIEAGTHNKPYAVAVDEENIYWTDVANNAVWYKSKENYNGESKKLYELEEKPGGLFVRNVGSYNGSNCDKLIHSLRSSDNHSKASKFSKLSSNEECLNNGEKTIRGCKCQRGFSGPRCEISIYEYYCIQGKFYYDGKPSCKCNPGFSGTRCEIDLCKGYCLNDGICDKIESTIRCRCTAGFSGKRCEINITQSCKSFCETAPSDITDNLKNSCKCEEFNTNIIVNSSNVELEEDTTFPEIFYNIYSVYGAISIVLILILTNIITLLYFSLRKHPRVKKRIIVNPNVKPLTYRSQPSNDQCEITIECCNMNICETPCFEPARFKSKKEEKKVLLSNMEGDDTY